MEVNLLIYFFGVVILIVTYLISKRYKKLHDLVLNTETSSITTLRKGFYEIKGKIVKLEEELVSPLQEKECVYYKFRVEQEKSSGKSSSWRTIIKDEKYVPFFVEDRSGKAIVHLKGAILNFNVDTKTKSGGFGKSASKEMENALSKYGRTSKAWIFEKNLRYNERFLEEGDNVIVIGKVEEFEGYYPVFKDSDMPYIVSDKTEANILKRYKLIYQIFLAIGIASIVGLIIFTLWRTGI